MTLIGVSNQIIHQIRDLRYIRQPPLNFPGYLSALTDDGIDELRDFIADFRRSPEEWDDFLQSVIHDPEIIQAVKAHKAR
jgi:hypothetical protein